ncbi:hypothetical protein DM01DRAFT_1384862 [Hesseltinella vesiculosa]|uniref:Uncharacterized protein n=1 Tax=Hesseltinella vesiculosa TaxID=101127 RepID=A0A1X2GBP5_9FUNG|nr:hypothetical protein DM01DRAFT_1384862 [Hesseltinella vesiculosa]
MFKQLLALSGLMALASAQNTTGNATSIPPSLAAPLTTVISATEFCLFLPPQPGLEVAINEDNGIPFCMDPSSVPNAQPFPQGFITTAHFYQNITSNYVQITGYFDRTQYNLSEIDEGGQYDSHAHHKPNNATCQGYPYFVSLIEPADDRFCIRCCTNTTDCRTGISQYGCRRVISGNYDYSGTFDNVPPSPDNENVMPPNATQPTNGTASAGGSSVTPVPTPTPTPGQSQTQPGNQSFRDPNSPIDSNNPSVSNSHAGPPPANGPAVNENTSAASAVSDPSTINSLGDEATYLSTQLAANPTDFSQLQSQFSTFVSNMVKAHPDQLTKLNRLNTIVSGFTTSDQWQQLATLLQEKAPSY